MKKVYSIFLLGCVVLLSLVSCQKDTVTLRARISTFSSPDKIYMEPVTDGCMPRWQNNDPVWINGNNGYTRVSYFDSTNIIVWRGTYKIDSKKINFKRSSSRRNRTKWRRNRFY